MCEGGEVRGLAVGGLPQLLPLAEHLPVPIAGSPCAAAAVATVLETGVKNSRLLGPGAPSFPVDIMKHKTNFSQILKQLSASPPKYGWLVLATT